MLRISVLSLFSVLVCDGQFIGAPFYPRAIGLSGGEFGGAAGNFRGGGAGGGHYVGGHGNWHPGLAVGGKLAGGGFGNGGFAGQGGGGGYGASNLGGKAFGGEHVDRSFYEDSKKNLNNHHFVQSHGKKGEELHHGNGRFSKGQVAEKNVKGDSVYFSDLNGGKNAYHEGKDYHGGQHYAKQGHGGNQQTNKNGHKKGHRIKGFKTSHHLDEHGGTEEYYDEAHDEGGNYAFNGESAGFGKNAASSFKGGQEGGKFLSGEKKNSGHYRKEIGSSQTEGNQGKFGSHKYSDHGGAIGEHKVVGSDDVSGFEDSRKFYKHLPLHY